MGHNKRIVVDFDDTLSVTLNRDFEGAKPIVPTIKKVNEFYENGYEVIILTARGQISCGGNHLKADAKYRKQIEFWLSKNGVKYTELSFNKILAKYYVDDKAIRPDEFAKLSETVLTKGKSGANVTSDGSVVTKTSKSSQNEIYWYNKMSLMKKPFKTPEIYSLVGETIKMEHIDSGEILEPEDSVKFNKCSLDIELILKFFKSNNGTSASFDSYIKRVKRHSDKNGLSKHLKNLFIRLGDIREFMDKNSSLNHGDMTLDNIMLGRLNDTYLIDSIYNHDLYSSFIIDIGKLAYDLRLKRNYSGLKDVFLMCERLGVEPSVLKIIELTHWVRVVSYIKDPKVKSKYINKIKSLSNDIE